MYAVVWHYAWWRLSSPIKLLQCDEIRVERGEYKFMCNNLTELKVNIADMIEYKMFENYSSAFQYLTELDNRKKLERNN